MGRGRRAAVLLPALLLCAVLAPTGAGATTAARWTQNSATSAARWAVVFTSSANPAASTTGALTVPLNGDSFVFGTNTGVGLGPRFTVHMPMTATGGATAELQQCSGAWDTVANTCAGSVSVVAVTGGANVYPLPTSYPSGYSIRFRVHPTALGTGNTVTVGATVRFG
jgi:hypothetical protein